MIDGIYEMELVVGAKRVVADLRKLADMTSDEKGAQRVAWTPVWQKAREWFAAEAIAAGAEVTIDSAGNTWAKLAGMSSDAVAMGSHLDSVPNGGWLDGALGAVVTLEVLRRYGKGIKPLKTVYAVNWADEEGARFGRSLMGSSAACGTLDVSEIANRMDNDGVMLTEALAEYDVSLETMLNAHTEFKQKNIREYLELHIEQGPVLESAGKQVACVYGVTGCERYYIEFNGQAVHAGSFPSPKTRKDAFLAAAQAALEFRNIAIENNGFCTVGKVTVKPDVVTIVPEKCVISLDQRSIDAAVLQKMHEEALRIVDKVAAEHSVTARWEKIWSIAPTLFDERLTTLCKQAVKEETGEPTEIYSGPLHDATEMAKIVPTVMLFAMSENGLSHCAQENTPDAALETSIRAFLRLVDKVMK